MPFNEVAKVLFYTTIYAPIAYLIFFCLRTVYRLTLHPLARFPGPKVTAATRWYEVFYEVYRGGRFEAQVEAMHHKYGPIVRIKPDELHISDSSFYDQLYNFSPHIERDITSFDNLQNSRSFEIHKRRRKALDPYFTKSAVQDLEFVISNNVELLCEQFYKARQSEAPLTVSLLCRCFTSEVVAEYLFGQRYGFLTNPEKSKPLFGGDNAIFRMVYVWRESAIMYTVLQLLNKLPESWFPKGHISHTIGPFMRTLMQWLELCQNQKEKDVSGTGHRVLFRDYHKLDLSARDRESLPTFDTAIMLYGAGFESTAYTIDTVMFHVLSNASIKARLREELTAAHPNAERILPWTELEKLPYLTAVITEGLRMSIGVMARLPRRNMKQDMVYKEWVIPKGTLVGMSQRMVLYDPTIYPEPRTFDPERWLKGEESRELRKRLVTFSQGARRCLGMQLAYAELYLVLATLFRRFDMELYETTRKDVDPVIDFFVPRPEDGGNGVRVTVH